MYIFCQEICIYMYPVFMYQILVMLIINIYSTSQKNVNNFEVQYYCSTVPVPYGKVIKKYRAVLVRVRNGTFKANR